MVTTEDALEFEWDRIDRGEATEQEKIDAVWETGERRTIRFLPSLERLLNDRDESVRRYALQCLVVDLKQTRLESTCWALLRTDPSEEVRIMAAACLGSILQGAFSVEAFAKLESELRTDAQSPDVKGSVRSALREIVGHLPTDPAAVQDWIRPFRDSAAEWKEIDDLRTELDAHVQAPSNRLGPRRIPSSPKRS